MKLCGKPFYFFITYVNPFPIQYKVHVGQAFFTEQVPRISDWKHYSAFCLAVFHIIIVLGNY